MNTRNSENEFEQLEQVLWRVGASIRYPTTPAITARAQAELNREHRRRPIWLPRPVMIALAALILAIVLLIAFPQAREAVADLLGLRSIRIIPVTPTPTMAITQTPATTTLSPTRTPALRIQCCETTLADVRARARFKILASRTLDASRVLYQELPNFANAQQVILVYGDPASPQFVLYQASKILYGKLVSTGTLITETRVKGQRALWLTGVPHILIYLDATGQPQFEVQQSVGVNTLIWETNEVTYRIETPLSLEEAIRFAESLE